MTNEQENPGAPSRQSPPLDVLLRWGDPAGIIINAVERFFNGLAVVSLVSLLAAHGTPGVAVGSDPQPQKKGRKKSCRRDDLTWMSRPWRSPQSCEPPPISSTSVS
jgi:hypothetical protein